MCVCILGIWELSEFLVMIVLSLCLVVFIVRCSSDIGKIMMFMLMLVSCCVVKSLFLLNLVMFVKIGMLIVVWIVVNFLRFVIVLGKIVLVFVLMSFFVWLIVVFMFFMLWMLVCVMIRKFGLCCFDIVVWMCLSVVFLLTIFLLLRCL